LIGVIVGDIAGSIYEFNNFKSKKFPLFGKGCNYTDDSIMALAVAKALMDHPDKKYLYEGALREDFVRAMRDLGKKYPFPMGAYGGSFSKWLRAENPKPYNSWGNGSAMRVAACGWVADSFDEAVRLGRCSAEVTHNHPEGIKGAQCVAGCIYLARTGHSKEWIKSTVELMFYPLKESCDEIRKHYHFDSSCQGTVPQAIQAFLEAESFEDAIRNAISLGGDADTLAAITGGIAEAYYGVPDDIAAKATDYLPYDLLDILLEFEEKYQ